MVVIELDVEAVGSEDVDHPSRDLATCSVNLESRVSRLMLMPILMRL